MWVIITRIIIPKKYIVDNVEFWKQSGVSVNHISFIAKY